MIARPDEEAKDPRGQHCQQHCGNHGPTQRLRECDEADHASSCKHTYRDSRKQNQHNPWTGRRRPGRVVLLRPISWRDSARRLPLPPSQSAPLQRLRPIREQTVLGKSRALVSERGVSARYG
jgi:hypothetical protein